MESESEHSSDEQEPLSPVEQVTGEQVTGEQPGGDAGASPGPDTNVLLELRRRVHAEMRSVIVGMETEIDHCLVALLCGGHVLLEGPPGVAKTLLVRSLATALGGSFSRVQFTPDLMPADVTGTSIFDPAEGSFRFRAGPIFAQFLLCDEINRAPAKTQAALLESMQEGTVTIDGECHELPAPFCVFATMNPIENEGTYPLPEAQLDRFLFKVEVGYPEPELEAKLLSMAHDREPSATPSELGVNAVTTPEETQQAGEIANAVTVRDDLFAYVVHLLAATRESPALMLGASPRAGVMLIRAAKAFAALDGRGYVTPDDLKSVFMPALRHRVALDPAEEIDGVTPDEVLKRVLESVEVPR